MALFPEQRAPEVADDKIVRIRLDQLELRRPRQWGACWLASVLYQKNDYFKARAFIQRFDALGQASPDALLLARNIEVKLGNAGAARDYAQRLREQFPDSTQTRSLDGASSQ